VVTWKVLRWSGHMERMSCERPLSVMKFKIDCSKKDRPKNRWKEVIDVDMKVRGLKRSDTVDRTLWRLGCRNRPTLTCGDKPGFEQIMTGAK